MTETPQNFFCFRFSILHTLVCDTLKNNDQKNLGRLSHICASLGQGVAVISVSMVTLTSQSYRYKLFFKRLSHISIISTPRVSLISVSFGSFCRTHIRHPPIVPWLSNRNDLHSQMFDIHFHPIPSDYPKSPARHRL